MKQCMGKIFIFIVFGLVGAYSNGGDDVSTAEVENIGSDTGGYSEAQIVDFISQGARVSLPRKIKDKKKVTDKDFKEYNKKAVIACWQNPAWNELKFPTRTKKRRAKSFLCSIPLQFRSCFTVSFIKTLRKKNDESSKMKEYEKNFNRCVKGTAKAQRLYGINKNYNSHFGHSKLFRIFKKVVVDKTGVSASLGRALDRAHPSQVFAGERIGRLKPPLNDEVAAQLGKEGISKYHLRLRDATKTAAFALGEKKRKKNK